MKNVMKNILVWFLLGFLMMVFQIMGMALGIQLFPSDIMDEAMKSETSLLTFFLTCLLNAGAILYFVRYSTLKGWKLTGVIFLLGFGLMYFMSQIETLWFNDSVQFPIMGIYGIVTGGAFMFVLFALATTWITGNFKRSENKEISSNTIDFALLWKRILLISVVIWPLLYFSAGYFIAWQFEAIRFYYTGSVVKESYLFMFADYLDSNLYLFQIFRGLLWVLLSMLVLKFMRGTIVQKGIALTMLLVFLCCIQLMLENPFMPQAVRMGHLLETSTENAILAIIMVWVLVKSPKTSPKHSMASLSQ
jgi:hypothetical protein